MVGLMARARQSLAQTSGSMSTTLTPKQTRERAKGKPKIKAKGKPKAKPPT